MAERKLCKSRHTDGSGDRLSCGRTLGHTGKHLCGCGTGCNYRWGDVPAAAKKKPKKTVKG